MHTATHFLTHSLAHANIAASAYEFTSTSSSIYLNSYYTRTQHTLLHTHTVAGRPCVKLRVRDMHAIRGVSFARVPAAAETQSVRKHLNIHSVRSGARIMCVLSNQALERDKVARVITTTTTTSSTTTTTTASTKQSDWWRPTHTSQRNHKAKHLGRFVLVEQL